jgi:hypothetical protein
MPWRGGQFAVFALWLLGVPALACGLAFDAVALVRAGGWSLLAAALLASAQVFLIVRHAFARRALTNARSR